MSSSGTPLLRIIAGPNGAGKTTCYEELIRPRLAAEFVNADRIAAVFRIKPLPKWCLRMFAPLL